MRIIFAGTPDFAAKHLQALIENELNVVAAYTQPDRPAGRGKKTQSSEVKKLAVSQNIPICQPTNFKSTSAIDELKKWKADIMVVVAYGILLPESVLTIPTYGCINVHGSILPKWRGAAPIQRSIWAGDEHTGVTIMQMDKGLDTGPILATSTVDIEIDETSSSLYDKLAVIGPNALVQSLNNFAALTPTIQDSSKASYAKKLSKEEAQIKWDLTASQLERNCRSFNPWPVQWFLVNDTQVKVWDARAEEFEVANTEPGTIISASKDGIVVSTTQGVFRMLTLQLPGKKAMSVADILNSRANWFTIGSKL